MRVPSWGMRYSSRSSVSLSITFAKGSVIPPTVAVEPSFDVGQNDRPRRAVWHRGGRREGRRLVGGDRDVSGLLSARRFVLRG